MIYLVIFNTLVCLYVLFKVQPYRLNFRIYRSFFAQVPLAFQVFLMYSDGYGREIVNITLRKPLDEDTNEDWHIHKLRHEALGCDIGVNLIKHTCEIKKDEKDVVGAGNAWLEKERIWNKENLKNEQV